MASERTKSDFLLPSHNVLQLWEGLESVSVCRVMCMMRTADVDEIATC